MSNNTVTLATKRVDLANNALIEITQISRMLRDFIAVNDDESGTIMYGARGMLARIQLLSETVTECLEHRDDERKPDAELFEVVECRAGQLEELSHG